jgi:hypothetical protein
MRFSLLSLVCLLPFVAAGQGVGNIYREDSSIKVFQAGVQRQLAFCGGFNAPQFAQADLNNDGLKDLVVFEWGENLTRTFLNKGTATAAHYMYAPDYAKNFPPCNDYLKLEDYNRDGIADLIHKGGGGFEIWKGYYNAQGQLSFTFYRQLRYDSPFVGNVNAYSQSSDIPGVVDVDKDGDLDFFGYDVNGGLITYYKNCQVELGLPKDSIRICIPSNCWGQMFQGFYRTYTTGILPGSGPFAQCSTFGTYSCKMVDGQQYYKEAKHQGNCMLMLDYEGDGDVDLLDGNISFPDIQLLRNGKADYSKSVDTTVSQDTLWQTGGHRVFLPQWPSAFHVDADGDGKKDLLVTPHDYSAGENYKTVQLYKNTGSNTTPIFSYDNDTFFVDKAIDLGSGAYPVLYDFNKDGKLDLFVGSEGYYTTGGTFRSRISYYQNSVVSGVTRFTWVTSDFGGLSAQGFQGAAPAFGDLDGDGDDDMVIGHTDGTMSYYKNTASGGALQPVWVLDQLKFKSTIGDTMDAGYYASPYIYDINKDGRMDLLVGNQTGRISYYQNGSGGGSPALTLTNSMLGSVEVVPGNSFAGFSSIWIGKMDNTGADFLVCGNGYGNISRYTGFQTGNVNATYTMVDSFYNQLDVGLRSTPVVGDVDGDGKYEMIVGNRLGGLNLFKQGPPVGIPTTGQSAAGCMVYPNPASRTLIVSWETQFADGDMPVSVELLNAVGQRVFVSEGLASRRSEVISVTDMATGIYTCRIQTRGAHQALKVSVIR